MAMLDTLVHLFWVYHYSTMVSPLFNTAKKLAAYITVCLTVTRHNWHLGRNWIMASKDKQDTIQSHA